jgi:hypothetical protein
MTEVLVETELGCLADEYAPAVMLKFAYAQVWHSNEDGGHTGKFEESALSQE